MLSETVSRDVMASFADPATISPRVAMQVRPSIPTRYPMPNEVTLDHLIGFIIELLSIDPRLRSRIREYLPVYQKAKTERRSSIVEVLCSSGTSRILVL